MQAKFRVAIMTGFALATVAGCTADDARKPVSTQSRNSIYDPMHDAAPGDELPSAPSVNEITPDQAMGGGSAGIIIPGNNSAAASLGALNGGRR